MARSRLLTLLFVPLAFMLMGARGAPLVDPAPLAVPPGVAAKDVSKAIRTGIATRGWIVSKDENGKIDATLNNREHQVVIAIVYDAKQVKINYVSSQNMNYSEKNGTRYIHKKYTQWTQNVVADINKELQLAAIKAEK
jgi:hypothetical protein